MKKLLFALSVLMVCSACGVDSTGATGELGNLEFSIGSDHYLPENVTLTETGIVTGYDHSFTVALTSSGQGKLSGENWEKVQFSASQASNGGVLSEVTVTADTPSSSTDSSSTESTASNTISRSVTIKATTAGTYTIEAKLSNEVIDRIQLTFATPDSLEAVVYQRAPGATEFTKALFSGGTETLPRGSQISWIAIGKKAGVRLIGDIDFTKSFSTPAGVVDVTSLDHINEDGVMTLLSVPSVVFIDAGAQVMTISDSVNGVTASVNFTIQ